jgi:hypothetical protein
LRPETIVIRRNGEAAHAGATPATIIGRSFHGAEQLVKLRLASGAELHSRSAGYTTLRVGDEVNVHVEGPITVLPARRDG